jgi:hypothetical protein
VVQHVEGDVVDVLRHDVAPAPDEGEGAGGLDEANAGPGAGAVGQQPVDVGQAVLVGRRVARTMRTA